MKERDRPQERPAASELVAMRQRVVELEMLQRTSLLLTSSLDLPTVLNSIAEGALALVGASDCLIYLYDSASDHFSFAAALGRWTAEGKVRPPRRDGLTATVARKGQPVVINEAVGHPLYTSLDARGWNIQAIAGFPLQRANQVLGVLHVVFDEPHTFSEDELRVLSLLADQAAIAVDNSQLYAQAQQEIAERVRTEKALRQLQALNEGIVQNTGEGIVVDDADGCFSFVNPAAAALVGYEVNELIGQHWTLVIPPDQQPIARAANERRMRGQADRYELELVRKNGTRVPIQVSGSPRFDANTGSFSGTLAVFTDLTERVRAEAELRKHHDHLEELVNERTAALRESNAQLLREIAERERAEAERERLLIAERAQAQRQAALFRLSAELAATLDETKVCQRVVHSLHDTLGYDILALYMVDETTGDRVHAASVGFIEPPAHIPPGQGLSERPLTDGKLRYTPDVTREPGYLYSLGGSEVDVPVRIGGKVLGVLIAERKECNAFSQEDLEVLTAAAQQAGLAIDKARLLAAERQRADELDALRTTMAEITAELELPTLLRAVVERAAGLLDATGGELGLHDPMTGETNIVVSHNLGEGHIGTRHALGEGAMGHVAQTGEPLIVNDYEAWEGRAPQYANLNIHAVLVVPLMVGSRLVGIISIAATDPARQFGPSDLHLLNLFAQQAAIAIENARLFAETGRRVVELATLTEIGQALSSTLRVDEVIQLVYEQTRRVMYAENTIIMLYDEEQDVIQCAFSRNPDDAVPGEPFPNTGLTGHILKHRRSILLRDNVIEGVQKLGLEVVGVPSASFLGVPMLRGERVLGAIILQHYETPHVYDESHQSLLETIASQAAIAIENARLYDQAQQEIAERERAEQELRQYQEHLEELVEERTADLQHSEERHRTLFEGVPVGLYRTTPAGQIVDANLAQVQMLGYPSREDLLAISAVDLYANPEDRVLLREMVEREGVLRDFETQLRRYDGEIIWANLTLRAVKDEQGQVLHYEGSFEEISERKRAEQELRKYQEHLEELVEERTAELRESEERYRTLFDGVPVGLYRTKPGGQIVDANRAFVQMLGFPTKEELLATDADMLYVNPQGRARWRALMDREGIVRDFEHQVQRYDGTVIWINDAARAVKDEQGQVLYYEGSTEDVTERKRLEQEIRRQKDYFEALFVNSPVAVVTVDTDANVVAWNPAAEKLFGYTQEEAIGRNVDDLVASDDSIRAEAAEYTTQGPNLGLERVQATTRRTRKDGSLVDVEMLGVPAMVAGQLVGFIVIYYDISELEQARKAAETANQAKSAFLANMSHELRTPLNAIIGFTRLVKRRCKDILPQKHVDNLDKVLVSADYLLELINSVLDLSKIEAGRVDVQPVTFDLENLVDVCLETVQPLVKNRQLRLVKQIESGFPQLSTDQEKLRQILINLLSNAIKFTEEGTVTVSARCADERLILEVTDTGIGIPEEAWERIFVQFQQVDNSTTRRYGGTGLGLSITRHLARLLSGDVTVKSTVGVGSTFTVTVPICYGTAAPASRVPSRPEMSPGESEVQP